jgi:16S rRNA (guanine(1405)-N(7))-methyltransferase
MKFDDHRIKEMTVNMLDSKKYRHAGLNPATVEDLIKQQAPLHASEKALLKAVRRKLHNIVAPYLGEPDYAALTEELQHIQVDALTAEPLQAFCLKVLSAHASTAERIPLMPTFYARLFAETGRPTVILDLACGSHPLAFPWMGLPPETQYHAYDILQPRVDFINQFFEKLGLAPLAENRDILVNPPTQTADLALFFKEAHRFEKRQPGCNRAFWASLNAAKLAVSLPSHDLAGTHSLLEGHRKLIHANLPVRRKVSELAFENEVVFLIEKNGES